MTTLTINIPDWLTVAAIVMISASSILGIANTLLQWWIQRLAKQIATMVSK